MSAWFDRAVVGSDVQGSGQISASSRRFALTSFTKRSCVKERRHGVLSRLRMAVALKKTGGRDLESVGDYWLCCTSSGERVENRARLVDFAVRKGGRLEALELSLVAGPAQGYVTSANQAGRIWMPPVTAISFS